AAMPVQNFDVIVVGAGIIGSTTAYHLQKAGKKTLMIEQFTLGHSNGSSHGKSRITKYAHADAEYVALVSDATAQIRELEKKRGEQLIVMSETGGVIYGSKELMEETAATLRQYNMPSEQLTASEARQKYPLYHYDDYSALVDPQAGLILADKWLAAFQDEFRRAGGTVSEHTLVKAFKEENGSVLLHTCKGDFSAPKVVFALGSWINKLLPGLPLKGRTEIISVCYWAPKNTADISLVAPEKWPVHIVYQPDGRCFLSMGSVDVPGAVKFIFHGGQEHYDTDVPAGEIYERFVEDVRAHIEKHVPFLDTVNGPVKVERCKYTLSPDAHYVIDYLPGSKNIQVAGCMSGTGFKNSPGVGRAVAQRAMDQQPFTDLSFFSLYRFKKRDAHL
ncbi:hypothetical protein PENTCL1PPCAC_28636, partial [Pristionchus entomophagus]